MTHLPSAQLPSGLTWTRTTLLRANPGWALAVFALGLVLTIGATCQRYQNNQLEVSETIEAQAMQLGDSIQQRLALYQYGLRGMRGMIHTASLSQLTLGQFRRYMATRDLTSEFPGALGFGVVYRVAPSERARFDQQARDEGLQDFAVHGITPHDGDLYVIKYVEPQQPNSNAVGLDIASEPARRQAAEASMRSGTAQLTSPLTLVQAYGQVRQGFLMLLPVYQTPLTPTGEAQRVESVVGWSFAPLLMKDVLEGLLAPSDAIRLELWDVTGGRAPAPFYISAVTPTHDNPVASFSTDRQIMGRTWHVALNAYPAFVAQLRQTSPWLILALGTLTSLLMGIVVHLLRLKTLRDRSEEKATQLRTHELNRVLETQVSQRTRELQVLNTLLKNVLDAATAVTIVATDLKGVIQVFNRGAERMTGYHAQEVVNRHTPELYHDAEELHALNQRLGAQYGRHFRGIEGFIAQSDESCDPSQHQCHLVRKDGTRMLVQLAVAAMRDHEQRITGYLGVAVDITAQHELESSLQAARDEAVQANQAKSAFLASMSHEIRTPMNAVLGMLQLTLQSELAPQQRDHLGRAQTAANLLLALLNDILDYSKIEAGKLQVDVHPFRLDELMHDLAIVLAGSRHEAAVRLRFELDPHLPQGLIGDSLRLQQILINLAGNALKFTPRGEVVIAVQLLQRIGNEVRIEFSVKDTGIGMPAEQLERLFQEFSQGDASTARKFGGSGLGLLICKRLTQLMDSNLQVESQQGVGSRFWFELRLHGDDSHAPASPLPEPSAQRPQRLAGLRLLLVEDNAVNQLVAAGLLKSEGASVEVANCGVDGVTRVEQAQPPYDLVLMDLQMPDIDGFEAARRIRRKVASGVLPIIAMTANVSAADREKCLAAGMDEHIGKPFDLQRLVDVILQFTGGSGP
jgi:PAS domain S-box-containing protein